MESQEHENKLAIGPKSLPKGDPRARMTGKLEVYAYALKIQGYGEFPVLNSSKGWWLDSAKLGKMIDAWKLDCTDEEALFYADVSKKEYEYFRGLHPEISEVKRACKENLGLHARQHFAQRVMAGEEVAVNTYLRKKHKAEFAGQLNLADQNGVKKDNAIVFVDFGESEVIKTEPYEEPKPLPEHAEGQ